MSRSIEHPMLQKMGFDLADLASLPLDIIAQEKGFTRWHKSYGRPGCRKLS